MLVDSHCHLDFPDFAEEEADVVARARRAGVGTMVTICTHVSKAGQVLAVAGRYPEVLCTIGVHPHHAAEELAEATVDRLVALSAHPKVIGLGETGLDYFYDNSPRPAQQESFRRHLRACMATGLPAIVHSRDADAETLAILREEGAGRGLTGLIHCFSGSRAMAEEALALGFHLSISGIVTFKKADALRETVAAVPLDRLLVETDAPDQLLPEEKNRHPLAGADGKPLNNPANLVAVYVGLADFFGEQIESLAARVEENFQHVFYL